MRILFYMGWVALVMAFAAAATEPFLVQIGRGGFMTSTYDLWYAMAPSKLVIAEIRVERIWPTLWDPILVTVLQAPAWVLAGAPGLALVWYCRPNRVMSPEVREEYERQKESLFVIDELSDQAKLDDNYDPHEDDRAPSHLLFDLDEDDDEDIRNAVDARDVPAGYPGLDYADEYIKDVERDRLATEELREMQSNPTDRDEDNPVRIIDGLAFSKSALRIEMEASNDDTSDGNSDDIHGDDQPDK